MRSLAQRSADAAHETGTLIEESRVTATQGAEQVALVVTTIAQFMERIGHIRALMDEIDGASREQATGVRQAAAGVHEVERGVQSASATAEETRRGERGTGLQAAVARSFVEDLRAAIRGTRSVNHGSFMDGGESEPPRSAFALRPASGHTARAAARGMIDNASRAVGAILKYLESRTAWTGMIVDAYGRLVSGIYRAIAYR